MRNIKNITAIVLAGTLMVGTVGNSWAFKKFLKETLQGGQAQEQQVEQGQTGGATTGTTTEATQQAPTANSGPIQFTNDKYGYKFEIPGRWQQMTGDTKSNSVLFSDMAGNKGHFQVHVNWMADDFPVQSSLQAMEKQNKDRLQHGELVKFYRKDFIVKDKSGKDLALFQGFVTIESTEDPDIRRMQWIGYGKGNYYNFTWSSNPAQFESYMPEFEQMLNNIQFIQ